MLLEEEFRNLRQKTNAQIRNLSLFLASVTPPSNLYAMRSPLAYLLFFVLTIATCFSLQHLALQKSGGRFTKCESNFFSSVGRIQAGAAAQTKIMALGSSITGRLPDWALGYSDLANMGADGGSAVDTLRAMHQGILPAPKWLIIEANTLTLALKAQPSEVFHAMHGNWFDVGLRFPLLSSYARPSGYFYSKLLAKKIGSAPRSLADEGFKPSESPTSPQNIQTVSLTDPNELKLAEELATILRKLNAQGTKSLIVWLPRGRGDHNPPPNWILHTAKSGNAYWWDYASTFPAENVHYSDPTHMDAASATRTTGDLLRAVERLDKIEH